MKAITRITIGVCIGILSASLVFRYYFIPRVQSKALESDKLYPKDGFDYSKIIKEGNKGIGPGIGEKIALSYFKTREGKTLTDVFTKGVAILAFVSSGCPMCRVSEDQMQQICMRARELGIHYYIVGLGHGDTEEFFSYADSLKMDAPRLLWAEQKTPPQESLSTMAVPSHVLVDRNGIILRKWIGTNQAKSVRQRIVTQVISDALILTETSKALSNGANLSLE